MSGVFEHTKEIAEKFTEKLNSLLENDTDIDINSTDDLLKKYTEYTSEILKGE